MARKKEEGQHRSAEASSNPGDRAAFEREYDSPAVLLKPLFALAAGVAIIFALGALAG